MIRIEWISVRLGMQTTFLFLLRAQTTRPATNTPPRSRRRRPNAHETRHPHW